MFTVKVSQRQLVEKNSRLQLTALERTPREHERPTVIIGPHFLGALSSAERQRANLLAGQSRASASFSPSSREPEIQNCALQKRMKCNPSITATPIVL